MPFNCRVPRRFTAPVIRQFAPAQSGVYGITSASEWIYIGEGDNIQQMLLAHLEDPSFGLQKRQPTGFVFESCDASQRTTRQDRLVLEYEPACNRNGTRHS